MCYPSAKFGDDTSSGFCVGVLTQIQYTHKYRAACSLVRRTNAFNYVGVSKMFVKDIKIRYLMECNH